MKRTVSTKEVFGCLVKGDTGAIKLNVSTNVISHHRIINDLSTILPCGTFHRNGIATFSVAR